MRKFVCIILIALILPVTVFMLTGCDKKNNNIKTFYSSYQTIGNTASHLKLVAANDIYGLNTTSYKIDVDYTKCNKLSTLVDNSDTQYFYLKHFYQQLLDDSLSPLYFFGEKISNSSKVSKKQAQQLFDGLEALKDDYEDLDHYLGMLMNSLNSTANEPTISLSYLNKVYNEYEQTINSANNLSSIVCDVYFGSVLSNPNYNYASKATEQINESDLLRISIDLRSRMYYYKSIYANIYNQLYVRGSNLAERLSSSTNATLPTYTPYNNIKNITSLNTKTTSAMLLNKKSIHSSAIALYNIQKSIIPAYNIFNNATLKVTYSKVNKDSSIEEKNCHALITQFSNGIAYDSYEVLSRLINYLYN